MSKPFTDECLTQQPGQFRCATNDLHTVFKPLCCFGSPQMAAFVIPPKSFHVAAWANPDQNQYPDLGSYWGIAHIGTPAPYKIPA